MEAVTVSAKIPTKIAEEVLATGFSTSDVIQVGVQLFLGRAAEEQKVLIAQHLRRKRHERALERYRNISKDKD